MFYRSIALALSLAGTVLAGCNRDYVLPAEPWQGMPSEPSATTAPVPTPPEPVPLPSPAYPTPPQKPSAEVGAARPSPVVDPDDPRRLVGLDLPETTNLLGDPAIAEEQPPGKILTYVLEDCRLQVFFYPDLSDQHFKALTFEFTGIEKSEAAERACFATMLHRNGT